MNKHKQSMLLLAIMVSNSIFAQNDKCPSSSIYLQANDKADMTIPFSITAEGHRFTPTWGLDQAWISEQNMRKGINHMGKENVGIGRSCFRMTLPLKDDALQGELITKLRERSRILALADPNLPVVLTADQEGTLNDIPVKEGGKGTDESYVKNKSANVANWSALINAHIEWLQKNTTLQMAGISPFNEPDYWSVEEGATPTKQRDVAKTLKEQYPAFADGKIAIVGGNTLNNDKALDWYTGGKQYYDWGNTHQLAGSFDTFAGFYEQLARDGKVGYGDEMHNVGEAMIGLEYGMTVGIWWGFDSRARGEFCDISRNGVRLAYDEHRNNWTAASVYRHDDGRVKAFIGSSERQAYTTSYQFVSPDLDVYYDGYGPVRELRMEIPGGTGYQKGQTNAERVINVTWGEDVQPDTIDGIYKIVNKVTGNVVAVNGSNITQLKFKKGSATQQWHIHPIDSRIGGDYSFYDIYSVNNKKTHINIKDFSTLPNAQILAYSENTIPSSNEQWYIEYAGDGYYYLRNRESALYMASFGPSTNSGVRVTQQTMQTGDKHDLLLWKILPVDVPFEQVAPAQPVGLSAKAQSASVRLSWTANAEDDLDSYMILRAPQGTEQWNTIARKVKYTSFVDNTCTPGTSYVYKIKAIDQACNISPCSETVQATPTGAQGLVACWQFDGNTNDATNNQLDAVLHGTPNWVADHASGEQSLKLLKTSNHYLQLPYEVANYDEMTIAMWVKCGSTESWQRLFDFGNGTNQYMFLTPSNGSIMRFAIKNGAEEQTVDCKTKLNVNKWKHVAVSIGSLRTVIYIDGVEAASSTAITIKPSDIHPVLNYIGRSQFAADPLFTGQIDDVRIYNHALNADDVQRVMGETDAIRQTQTDEEPHHTTVYNLGGQKLTSPEKGINIINGKKVFK